MPAILDALPALYRDLLPEFFASEVPAETKATCSSCAMCPSSARNEVAPVDGQSRLFRPDTKCCTFYPRLPNYLVGALLEDDSPAMARGRARIEAKIARGVGVTPQWVKPPARYSVLYDEARRAFGRAAALRCPYFDTDTGGCTVWAYREAVCSTFFCKYVAGADGRTFWMSLKSYLTLLEIQLSRYALYQLHPRYVLDGHDRTDAKASPLTADDLDDARPPAADYARLWGEWAGRETELYRACHAIVRALAPSDLERLLGFDGVIAQGVLRAHRDAAVAPLPGILRLDPGATVTWLPDGTVALGAYSEYDAVALPGEAYGLLKEFTGREPVEAVRARLRTVHHADLDDDVLAVLHRHRVLVEPA